MNRFKITSIATKRLTVFLGSQREPYLTKYTGNVLVLAACPQHFWLGSLWELPQTERGMPCWCLGTLHVVSRKTSSVPAHQDHGTSGYSIEAVHGNSMLHSTGKKGQASREAVIYNCEVLDKREGAAMGECCEATRARVCGQMGVGWEVGVVEF